MHRVEITADLQVVGSSHRDGRKVVVVAQLDAALIELLIGTAAADPDDPFVVEADQVGVERRRIPAELLIRQDRLV